MKILSIIAQKPLSTGSGIYLSELSRCFSKMGYEHEIICGVYEEDDLSFLNFKNLKISPLYFCSNEIPFSIVGMSDVMPYKTLKYSEIANDESKLNIWINAWKNKIKNVVNKFNPDIIICHHLYLLTAITREICKNKKVYGICHNTGLRQYTQTNLLREYIKYNINKLDKIFALNIANKELIIKTYGVDKNKIEIIGIGYNSNIFKIMPEVRFKSCRTGELCEPQQNRTGELCEPQQNRTGELCEPQQNRTGELCEPRAVRANYVSPNNLLYVGKISIKKGVLSLIKAINLLNNENIILDLIGGMGDKTEYEIILNEANKSKSKINFIGELNQNDLAIEYNKHSTLILPSFSEGLPMVPIEAMACGCNVIISNLPGVKEFYDKNIKNADIKYIDLPKLKNYDNADNDELIKYEKRLANAIKNNHICKENILCDELCEPKVVRTNYVSPNKTVRANYVSPKSYGQAMRAPDLSQLTWDSVVKKILGTF